MNSIRLLVADDHGLVRGTIVDYLGHFADFEVVGQASDGKEAIALVKDKRPDVAMFDVAMPTLNGIEATRYALEVHPALKVVILSGYADDRYVVQALQAGAAGYILKACDIHDLERSIRTVARGETYLHPSVAGATLRRLLQGKDASAPAVDLSARQREVLQLIAEGYTTKEIAHHLSLSPKTVETHRAETAARLGARGVADLVRHAIRIGLISLDG